MRDHNYASRSGLIGPVRDMASEERLRLAAEAAQFGICDADPVTGTLCGSAQACAILGVSPDTAIDASDRVPDWVHPAQGGQKEKPGGRSPQGAEEPMHPLLIRGMGAPHGQTRGLFGALRLCRYAVTSQKLRVRLKTPALARE